MPEQLVQTVILGATLALVGCQSSDSPSAADMNSGGSSVATSGGNGLSGAGGAASGAATGGSGALAGSGGSPLSTTAGTSSIGNSGAPTGGSAGTSSGGVSGAGSGTGGGGTSSTGGAAGAGGAGGGAGGAGGGGAEDPPCPPSTPPTGGRQVCGSSGDGTADGKYTYNLWSDNKGSGCMTVYGVDAAFKATWMNVGDWIARVGLSFDKTKTYEQLGTFSSDFAYTTSGITTGGFGNVGVYGWTVNPLHEFYIEEDWLGKAPNFTKVGSFTIEGEGTYEVMTNTQTNQPNITGTNATFVQYWSVRSTPRKCGHISISKHFDQWKSLGLELGKLEEARISVEAQNNSGSLDFTTATLVVTP